MFPTFKEFCSLLYQSPARKACMGMRLGEEGLGMRLGEECLSMRLGEEGLGMRPRPGYEAR